MNTKTLINTLIIPMLVMIVLSACATTEEVQEPATESVGSTHVSTHPSVIFTNTVMDDVKTPDTSGLDSHDTATVMTATKMLTDDRTAILKELVEAAASLKVPPCIYDKYQGGCVDPASKYRTGSSQSNEDYTIVNSEYDLN